MALRIGIDVGGTTTDAVLLGGPLLPPTVLAKAKAPTTADVLSGIYTALHNLQQQHQPAGLRGVRAVFLGTTQFVNAVVQRRGLARVFVVRLCGTATRAMPPFLGIPGELQQAVAAGHHLMAHGGLEFDGVTEISAPCDSDAAAAADMVLRLGVGAVVVGGVHSPLNPAQEVAFAQQLEQQLQHNAPGCACVPITLSHQVSGRLGLLERESAAILNAALQPLAAAVIPSYRAALDVVDGLQGVPLYLSGNDGTLVTSAQAQQHPILTFRSGPVNSLRGAAALSGLREGLVVDIGGTTSDVAALVGGLPRMSGALCDICGVVTSFRMPLVSSIGLGGGSLVSLEEQAGIAAPHHQQQQTHQQQQQDHDQPQQQQQNQQQPEQQQQCCVGPVSVGSDLTSRSLVCGGNSLTASDVAVLLHDRLPGLVRRSDVPAAVSGAVTHQQLQLAWQVMQQQFAAAVDAAKTSSAAVPLVVVGGGAGLCGDTLPGVSRILTPQHADVANAIGAAIPSVAGAVDTLLPAASGVQRQAQIAAAVQQAVAAAVAAGAAPGSVEVVEQEEVAVSYGPAGSVRLQVRAVGELQLQERPAQQPEQQPTGHQPAQKPEHLADDAAAGAALSEALCMAAPTPAAAVTAASSAAEQQSPSQHPAAAPGLIREASDGLTPSQVAARHSLAELAAHRPSITAGGLWEVCELDLDAIAVGAQVLGAGGGGSARLTLLSLRHAMQERAAAAAAAGAASFAPPGSTRYMMCKAGPGRVPAAVASGSSSSTEAAASDTATAVGAAAAPMGASAASSTSSSARPCVLSLAALQDDALLCDVGGMGAPTVSAEKLDSFECAAAVRGLSGCLAAPLSALLCAEVGGGNALEPLAVGLRLGLPVVDADLMGRAFPELQMSTAAIAGVSLTPAAVADDKNNVLVMTAAAGPDWAEKVLRAACTEMGCSVGLASTPMSGARAKEVVVPGSLSLAWSIGMALLRAQAAKADPVAALLQLYQGQGRQLLRGKVVGVERRTEEGFVRGRIHVLGEKQKAAAPAATTAAGSSAAVGGFSQADPDAVAGSASGGYSGTARSSVVAADSCRGKLLERQQLQGLPEGQAPAVGTGSGTAAGASANQAAAAAAAAAPAAGSTYPTAFDWNDESHPGCVSHPPGALLCIDFQNENLIARVPGGRVLGCVPDLICLLDSSTGAAVATEEVRYGLQVAVVVLPAHPLLRTPAALRVVGPGAFGYGDVVYEPVGAYPEVPTVHAAFGACA